MSDLIGGLMSQFGGQAISQLAGSIGGSEDSTKSALGAALPIIVSAMAKNASTPEGASSLNNALEKDHDGGILDNLSGFLGGGNAESMGAGILGHVLGSKTQTVEKYVSDDSGLSSGQTAQLLKMAAPLVMGYLAKQKQQAPGDGGSMITGLLSSALASNKANAPQSQNVIEQLLDQNNDGSVIDDVAKLGMSFLGNMFKK